MITQKLQEGVMPIRYSDALLKKINNLQILRHQVDEMILDKNAQEIYKDKLLIKVSIELTELIDQQQIAEKNKRQEMVYLNRYSAEVSPFFKEDQHGDGFTIGMTREVANKIHSHVNPSEVLTIALESCGWDEPQLEDVPEL